MLVSHPDNQQYVGRNVSEIAETEGKKLGEVLLDISLKDDLNSEFKLEGVLNADKQAVAEIVKHPLVHLGASDAGAHITQFCGTGDTTFFLEQYVLKDKSLTLVSPTPPLRFERHGQLSLSLSDLTGGDRGGRSKRSTS